MGETERDKDKVNVVCDWSFFFSARLCVIGSVCVGKYIIARFFLLYCRCFRIYTCSNTKFQNIGYEFESPFCVGHSSVSCKQWFFFSITVFRILLEPIEIEHDKAKRRKTNF